MMLSISKLRCEYLDNPIGMDTLRPRISWQLQSGRRGVLQSAYQIQVSAGTDEREVIWDSGLIQSDRSVHVELERLQVQPRSRYYYRVQAWAEQDQGSGWSDWAFWETGLMSPDAWQAEWIAAPKTEGTGEEHVPYLRRSFELHGTVQSARIYATALGVYELELNGTRVGDSYFTPGWTSYKHRLQYQTYDVTAMLKDGGNVIGAMLGRGWYSGYLTWKDRRKLYGDGTAFMLQLHIRYTDGREKLVTTDDTWKAAGSPILMSELYHGETYDARLELKGWSTPQFDDSSWHPVSVHPAPSTEIIAQENESVRAIDRLTPIAVIKTPKGETVIDMGQNMVGWVRFTVKGQPGREVTLEHAEVLDAGGNFYTENMRSAQQTIRYIPKSDQPETYEPRFTFQGFRYVRLTGFAEPIRLEDITGVVLHSDMERTGHFECSDPLVNQLQHNILWGQKGNFLDVPTDCPQRDERLGWTGDAQMFIQTASFLMNVAPFFSKWLKDLKADQREDGGVPFVIPDVLENGVGSGEGHSSSAWGDAAVICPWTIYLCYGDKRILEEQYGSMKAWVDYIRSQGDNPYLWNTGFHFGDWLGLDSKPNSYVGATDRDFIATSFYAYSVSLFVKTARVLGREEDAGAYAELYTKIIDALTQEFVTPSGRLSVPTQTANVLALHFGLVEGEAKERAEKKLLELLEEAKMHLTTGFVGTPYLNLVLSDTGHHDAACQLLFQTDYPSWLYQVTKGATTIWEHWDGIKEDGSFWSKDMNSFNHYAYGSIGDWLYRRVAGINTVEDAPGYKQIRLSPQPSPGLTRAKATLESMYGTIESGWQAEDGKATEIHVTIPANTKAVVLLPGTDEQSVRESGNPLSEAEGVDHWQQTEGGLQVSIGSGSYRFVY